MSGYYQETVEEEKQRQKGEILYRTAREIRVPYDYFEEIRKGMYYYLERDYVTREKCLAFQSELVKEIHSLRKEIAFLDSRLTQIENSTATIVEIRDIDIEEAMPLVQKFAEDFLRTHECLYPSDVAEELGLDYGLVREIFAILEKEGKLKKKGE
jgi:CRISPR/Cas system-associated protein Cas5 (RAMP superfamily)